MSTPGKDTPWMMGPEGSVHLPSVDEGEETWETVIPVYVSTSCPSCGALVFAAAMRCNSCGART